MYGQSVDTERFICKRHRREQRLRDICRNIRERLELKFVEYVAGCETWKPMIENSVGGIARFSTDWLVFLRLHREKVSRRSRFQYD